LLKGVFFFGYMVIYGTGINGFIGMNLAQKLPIISIPHEKIQSTKMEPFDYFYFLSSYGNLVSHNDEDMVYKANVEDLMSILKKIKGMRFKSFVFMSSSSVMLKTQTTYSRMKRVAEEILLAYMERHDVPICIIRPFSATGVGEQGEHLIPTLLAAAKTGNTVNFVSHPVHDFIDVDDLVSGIISLSEHSARGIFQLGTGRATTNQEVLAIVEKITGEKVKINPVDSLRAYDNTTWVSNNYKARGYGWLPKKSLEESIREQWEAMK
jgi:nucleoside-diphosphate-sugar epimerase